MSRIKWLPLFAIILLVAGLAAAAGLSAYYSDLPNRLSQHETLLLGQNSFTPGSTAAVRVVVRDTRSGAPLEGAQISLSLKDKNGSSVPLYQGKTGLQGSADVSFKVPAVQSAGQTLVVETRSSLGSDTVERPVTVERSYRVLLTTDKPIYQPGQVIHLRALALASFDLQPAQAQPLELTVADGKGNKVFRQALSTSAYGVAAADFTLASEVNTGAYKITAKLGNTSSEKTVTVENYVLPKFGVKLEPEKTFYLPGEKVRGTLRANYFYGKPVAGGKVSLEGYTFDVQRNVALKIDGQTDPQGNYTFEFSLPAYLTGSELDQGRGRFYLQAAVTDLSEHTEQVNTSLPVSRKPLVIQAVPEGGAFRANLENILYVLVSYPDGSPVEANLKLTFASENNAVANIATGPYGLAEVRRTPRTPQQVINIEARDKKGNLTTQQFNFQGVYSEETVLLRPEKPVYQVGQPMQLAIFTSQPSGTVYLDILREHQVVSTRAVEIKNGQAAVTVDLTPDLYGTLELNAYKLLRTGATVRDTRLVVVDPAEGLKIQLSAGRDTYKPGETAQLGVSVTGADGQGAQSVLGLSIVDESVYALAQQDPGFAKLYFMLEQQLLEPKYDLHGYSLPDLLDGKLPADDPALSAAVGKAAQASLAEAALKPTSFSLQANSHQDNLNKANTLRADFFKTLGNLLTGLVVLIPLAMLALTGANLVRRHVLGRSLLLALSLLGLLALAAAVWPLGSQNGWANTFAQRLGVLLTPLINNDELFIGVALLAAAGLVGLIAAAVRRRERALGGLLALTAAWVAVVILLVYAFIQNPPDNNALTSGLLLAGMLLFPLAFWLVTSGLVWQRRGLTAASALMVTLLILFGVSALLGPAMGRAFSHGIALPAGAVDDRINDQMMELAGAAPMRQDAVSKGAVPAPVPTSAPAASTAPTSGSGGSAAAEPPRLRQYFPETMLWQPAAVTDANGSLRLDVPVADSITTWRITALASTQDGHLGSAAGPLRVFQDFFVDLDLPTNLTVGDEIAVPVGVFNYLPAEQTVRLELAQADWFELKDQPVKEIKIASNEISVVYFRVRARTFGSQPFQVTATGSKMSDAIKKEVTVYPDGKQFRSAVSDRLAPGTPVRQTVSIPASAVAGASQLWVKIYPGMLSQVVDGLDGILRLPNGCFEQTSSTTYPNVLVLDYLKAAGKAAPEAQLKAEQYINLGYQRLTTFEVKSGGGFSLFGNEPADRMLTAYGLQEFSDMSRVYEVDPALIQRAGRWLLAQQDADGSWKNDKGLVHENTWQSLGNDRLPVTAYISWSLVEAGFNADPGLQKGLAYVRANQAQAKDPYALALVANALVAADLKVEGKITPPTAELLARLAALAQRDGDKAFWTSSVASFMGSTGLTGSIETTALASLALQRAGLSPDLASAALSYLLKQKDSFGAWHNTQATVLTLKALIQSVRGSGEQPNASVTVTLNGSQTRTVQITPQNFDVVQLLSFTDLNPSGANTVEIRSEGQGSLMYQVASSYYLPWSRLADAPATGSPTPAMDVAVKYDRAQLAVNDTVAVNVTVRLTQKGARAESALVDLGLPPGFTLLAEDLDAQVANYAAKPKTYAGPALQRYELTGRQALIYLTNLAEGQPVTFSYRLRARFPLAVQAPASSAYDYYNPSQAGDSAPQALVVK